MTVASSANLIRKSTCISEVFALSLARTVLFESLGTFGAFEVRSAGDAGESYGSEPRLQAG